MKDLRNIGYPNEFWTYFYDISKIPRCSQKEELIREFVKNEAEKLNFETKKDEIGNLVIHIPSKTASGKKIVLQSHMDMVCEKNNTIEHDFSEDPLQLELINIEGEEWLTAKDTTLGADNAVGMAYQLALMKKIHDGELNFEPVSLDLLFTVDEERGLSGASQMDVNLISGEYLINLDSEEDKEFTIGCAGGRVFIINIEKAKEKISKDKIAVKVSVSGLIGGHSGVDINKGRGNALKILSEILWKLNSKYDVCINSIEGGNLSNAIPREANFIIFIKNSDKEEIFSFIDSLEVNISQLYKGIEPDLEVKIQELPNFNDNKIFNSNFQKKLISLFNLMPTGPLLHHPTSNGLVHTSINFAAIRTFDEKIEIKVSTRSLTEYEKDNLFERIQLLLKMSQLNYDIKIETVYPSWSPDFNSDLVKISRNLYKELFDEKVIIKAIHAGLECAFFSKYYPKMQMISIGPDIKGGHSPDERLRIKSVEKIWKFLINLIKRLVKIS